MRLRTCWRVIDARANQGLGKIFLNLECRHNLIINMGPGEMPTNWVAGGLVQCPHCPGPTQEEVKQEKSAQQLWREAAEP